MIKALTPKMGSVRKKAKLTIMCFIIKRLRAILRVACAARAETALELDRVERVGDFLPARR
jgi:hypothetical protein